MKKFLALVMVLALAFSFAACKKTDTDDNENVQANTQEEAQNNTVEDAVEPEETPSSDLVILDESLAPEEYAIGFAKGNDSLCYAVEAALAELQKQGKLAEISTKWFGEDKMIFTSDADVAQVDVTALPNEFKLGLDASFPPMGYTDENGAIVGFDIDLAQAVCDYYSMTLTCVPIDWDAKDMELSTGNIDCIWNGLTVTDERLENYCMSAPYLANRQVVVVKADSGINTLADLAGKRVALQSDSSAAEALEANEEVNSSIGEKVELLDNLTALMDLRSGNVDAVAMDEVVASYVLSNEA